jgi:hypothetical protein
MRKTIRLSIVNGALLAIALLLTDALTLQAQTESFRITGKLVSPIGAPPCGTCQVWLENEHGARTTLINIIGEFRFENVEVGGYVIRISAPNFREARKRVHIDAAVEPVNIQLEEKFADPVSPVSPGGGEQVLNVSTLVGSYPRKAVEFYRRLTKKGVTGIHKEHSTGDGCAALAARAIDGREVASGVEVPYDAAASCCRRGLPPRSSRHRIREPVESTSVVALLERHLRRCGNRPQASAADVRFDPAIGGPAD